MLPLVFGLVAIIIFFAFISGYASQRTGLPEIIFLMLLGVLVGPVLQVVKVEDLAPIAPFVSTLAVTLILFDSGLKMDLVSAIKESGRAIILGVLGFVFSFLTITAYTTIILNWDTFLGLIVGCVIGGTSSIIVIPILNRLGVNRRVTTILSLESIITDVLVIVCALGLLKIWSGSQSEGLNLAKSLFDSFALGGVIGAAGGLIWLKMLNTFSKEDYNGILTLGVMLGLYSVSEIMQGSGALAALTFGLILGNGVLISKKLKLDLDRQLDRVSLGFHEQITFLLKSVVFVYLGVLLSLINPSNLIIGVGAAVVLLLVRAAAVYISSLGDPILSLDRRIMTFLLPRGLTAAAVAQLAVAQGLPDLQTFNDIYISVILSTIFITIVGTRLPTIRIPLAPRLKISLTAKTQKIADKGGSNEKIVERFEDEDEQHYLLRQQVASCLLNNKKLGLVLAEPPKSWNFRPDLYLKHPSCVIAIEVVVAGTPQPNEKKIISEINSYVERYALNGFEGVLKIVLNDLTVLRNLRALYLLNRYYELTEVTRGFKITLNTIDPNKKKLISLNKIVRSVVKEKHTALQRISL
mgnify:CR=1 FL=1